MTPPDRTIPQGLLALAGIDPSQLSVDSLLSTIPEEQRNLRDLTAIYLAYSIAQQKLILARTDKEGQIKQIRIGDLERAVRKRDDTICSLQEQVKHYQGKEKEDQLRRRAEEAAYATLKAILPEGSLEEKYPGPEAVLHLVPDLHKAAHTDHLMGIGNKRLFDKTFPKYIERLKRGEIKDVSLLFADVDDFRDYNKKKGHRKGDAILTGAGTVATTTFPKSLIAKYGGEEIAVVDEESLESAYRSAERFRLNIENSRFGVLEESDRPVTITVGVATYERGMTPGDLIDRADEAMQHAKRAGKNRVHFYDPNSKLYVPFHKE